VSYKGKADQAHFAIIYVVRTNGAAALNEAMLTNSWTRNKQPANTPPPQSTTPGMVAFKNFSRLLPPRTFNMMVPLVLLHMHSPIPYCWRLKRVGQKEVGKGHEMKKIY